jgi:hypothetical protein
LRSLISGVLPMASMTSEWKSMADRIKSADG